MLRSADTMVADNPRDNQRTPRVGGRQMVAFV